MGFPQGQDPQDESTVAVADGGVESWPQKGGVGSQPWDVEPGQDPDEMPVRLSHNKPILVSGAGGDEVRDLGQRLGELGYESSVTRGENPFNVFDVSLETAVSAFCRDYNVQEDPSGFGGNNPAGVALAAQHVGPWVWEAVLRASDRGREDA